jgi:hypothetical protein
VNGWEDSLDAPGGFDPIYTRHFDVHNDDLRSELERHLDRRMLRWPLALRR